MKITELLDESNITKQKAFLLGMIYAWPIYTKNKKYIFAYSSYKLWERMEKSIWNDINKYYNKHLIKLTTFINDKDYKIDINSNFKKSLKKFDKNFWDWVSVIFENNLENNIYSVIEKWLIDIDDKYKKWFLRWIMESRGSLDFVANFYVIDIANKNEPKLIKRKLNRLNDILWMTYNYNPRILQPNSNEKNPQFRINMEYYVGHYGFFRPHIIEYYEKEKIKKLVSNNDLTFIDNEFINKKQLKWTINFEINEFTISLIWLTKEEKLSKVKEYKLDNFDFDSEEELMYSSYNTKELAKKNAWYKCEYKSEHKTFKSNSTKNLYVEAHHLIPFSKRKEFEINIDIEENLVALCPNCHRKIHLAIKEEKIELLEPLYNLKIKNMIENWIKISKEELFSFYNV